MTTQKMVPGYQDAGSGTARQSAKTHAKKKKATAVVVPDGAEMHMPPKRNVHASAKKRQLWFARDGKSLEPALRSGAIALLDAEWIVQLAAKKGILAPRQLLPPEAFATVEEVIAATTDADQPVPVAAGLLLGLVLGQATVVELFVGMAGAGLVVAVDPLDAAAAALSVLMAVALVVAVALSAHSAPAKEPEARFDSFI